MLRGRYEHSVDVKGRIAFPARYREELGEDDRLIVTRHLTDPCLVVYPFKEWAEFEARLAKLSPLDPKITVLRRLYVGMAHDVVLDKQGRLLIPPELRRDASLERDAVWSGAGQLAELWAKPAYETHIEEVRRKLVSGEMQDLLSKLAELGI